ncbi:MAG: hypothetical protein EB101_08360 [Chitinophagia bacterium]|nr:hypothetical protein [Chitinophagia bacterium]
MQASKLTMQDEFELAKTRMYYESRKTEELLEAINLVYTAYLKQKHMIQLMIRDQLGLEFDTKLSLFSNEDDDDDDNKELIGVN